MKRVPLVASFLLFILLCASVAYWGMQLFKPPLRPVAAPPRAAQPEIRPEAAAALFGSRQVAVAAASNYKLVGVIYSGNPRDSIAIISADGKPAQAIRVDREIDTGVTIKEVHRGYVVISEGGTSKRVELPADAPAMQVSETAPQRPSPALPPIQRTPTPMPSSPVPNSPQPTRAQTAASGGVPMQIGPSAAQQQQLQQQQQQTGAPQQQAPMGNATTAPPGMVVSPPGGAGASAPPPGVNPEQQGQPENQ